MKKGFISSFGRKPYERIINNTEKSLKTGIYEYTNEDTYSRSCIFPNQAITSSQRKDLSLSLMQNMVIPIFVEPPKMDSCMAADMIKYSSCIKEINQGIIKLISKHTYQLRTIYIYTLNNKVYVYDDNSGTIISQRLVNNMKTDLDKLELNEEYDLNNSDPFYLKYPEGIFNPSNGLYGYGNNILSTTGVEFDNSQDSCAVSESFLNKFITRETRSISIPLNNKKILSRWDEIFPKIGEIINEEFLFKVVSAEGDMYTLAQSSNLPAGEEDDTVVTYLNSILVSVEVYSNSAIDNEILEKHRRELIKFRQDIYFELKRLRDRGLEFDNEALVMMENFSYTKFRTNKDIITKPLVKLRIDSLSRPTKGFKFSNRYGGKYTVQSIYPDGAVKDEFGRNIELCYSAVGILSRMIPSALVEVWFTGLSEHIKRAYENNKVTLEDIKNFYLETYTLLGEQEAILSLNKNLSKTEWETIIKNHSIPIIVEPFSVNDILGKTYKIRLLAKKFFDYKKLKVTHYNNNSATQLSTVGYIYTFRLSQDSTTQTSAVANPEVDKRNIIKDDDENKKKGLSKIKRKASKHCVQTNHLSINMVPDPILYESIVNGDDVMNAVNDHFLCCGSKMIMYYNNEEDDLNKGDD